MLKIRLWVPILLVLGVQWSLLAQEQISEGDLTLEQLFLDANLQKVIGNEKKAIAAFEAILETYPDHPAAAFELSRLYQQAARMEDALKMATIAVEGEPDNKWYKVQLADLYTEDGSQLEAIELYDALIEREPLRQELYFKQAFFYVKAGDIKGAIKVYEALEKKIGLSEEVVQRKHILYLGEGDFKAAGRELLRLTSAYPEVIDYQLQLAAFYEQIDDQKAAIAVYRHILEIDPDQPRAKLAMVGNSTGKEDELRYLNQLKPVFEDPTASIDLKIGKMLPLLEQLRAAPDPGLANALEELTDILERVHADDAKSYAAAGDVRMNSGRLAEAVVKYKKAIELDDTIYAVWEQLLYALQVTGNAKDQAIYAEEASYVFPNQAMIYYQAGLGHLGLLDIEEALYNLQEAQLIAGQHNDLQELILSAIGLAHTFKEDFEQAEAAFNQALDINPESGLSNTRYAILLSLRSMPEAAQQRLAPFEEQGHNQAIFAEAKALSLAAEAKLAAALEVLMNYQETYGGLHPRQLELLGDFYQKNGDSDQALIAWKAALLAGSKSNNLAQKVK